MLPIHALPEVELIVPRRFADARGYFEELWVLTGSKRPEVFVQDNLSYSKKDVLRGLHLQHPGSQAKLVMAITGTIWDVAVDVRMGSPTFGKWVAAELSEENGHQLYVPRGFAHGFIVLSDAAHVHYKCDAPYSPASEITIRYDDPELAIAWPSTEPQLAPRDRDAPTLAQLRAQGRLPHYDEAR
jgi:dTDP-4-dehydrorhamnose 3,5-epimerase